MKKIIDNFPKLKKTGSTLIKQMQATPKWTDTKNTIPYNSIIKLMESSVRKS